MVELALVTGAIQAASAGVALFDKIADQVERFITKQPEPAIPRQHRAKIELEGDRIVQRRHGDEWGTITADDLANLPEPQLRHIQVLERSMEAHYALWESVYPQLATMDSPVQKAKVEQQLKGIIRDMRGDLEGILSFLESCGLQLDDHYQNVRWLVAQV